MGFSLDAEERRAYAGFDPDLVPGARVRALGQPAWGGGTVQSREGARLTVSFDHAGKRVLDVRAVQVEVIHGPEADTAPGW